MKEKLTIIIATHNRPALIARALDYYMKWNCTIFVCDSSCDRPKFVDSPKIQVLHTPELLYNQKIHEALKKVITPYVCMSADDDFLAESIVIAKGCWVNGTLTIASSKPKYNRSVVLSN